MPVNNLPLVTIVTPSYNQAAFLEATIQSVLSQEYPRLEYIIMDGGSTDGSVEIIKKYAPQLAYWVSERDKGQSDAINKGWQRARGDIVAYLNSDDTYAPHAIRTAAEYLQEHPEVGLAYGDCTWMNVAGGRIGMIDTHPFTLADLLLQNRIAQPATFVRKSALDHVGLLNEKLHMLMDYELWVRLALRYPLGHISVVLANFRIHPTSKTGTSTQRFLGENLEIIERAFTDPALPRELMPLKPRAIRYVYVLMGANAYALGQFDAGRAILEQFFREQPNPLQYRQDVIKLFANHGTQVAMLGYSENGLATDDPAEWLARVMRDLPSNAIALRALEPEIIAEMRIIQAFGARQKGAWADTRTHVWKAVQLNPTLLMQRGIASLFVQSLAKSRITEPMKRNAP